MKNRALYQRIWAALSAFKPMVFMAGPRQAGKTTLARQIARTFSNHLYFNYDIIENKRQLVENPRFYEELNRRDNSRPLVILDEIHKHHAWKNYLKGVYDRDSSGYRFLVLGSGRLDIYQKGGDSLAGRYVLFHLWPFTLAELMQCAPPLEQFLKNPLQTAVSPGKGARQSWEHLSRWSGFPEPYLAGSDDFYTIWSRNYRRQLLREDIRSLVAIQKADQMELLFSLLPSRVGSPVAMDNLARDIGVSFDSVKGWLEVFEDFFLVFRISPWTKKIARSIRKEKKLYLLDYAGIKAEGARFENMAAMELFRAVQCWNACGKGEFALHYVRTREKEEVDFLVAEGGRPLFLVEAKTGEDHVSSALKKVQRLLNVPAIQLINKPGVYKRISNGRLGILIVSAEHWLAGLP